MPSIKTTDFRLQTSEKQTVNKKGFSLVELMVAVSIISLLSVAGIVVYTSANNRAKVARVDGDMNAIIKNIVLARERDDKTLYQITGSGCSECAACHPPHLTNEPGCIDAMRIAYTKITTAEMPLDPWGGAYTWDENELESGLLVCCHNPPPIGAGNVNTIQDFINSGGPNHSIDFTPGSGLIHKQIPPKLCSYANATQTADCSCTPGLNCAPPL